MVKIRFSRREFLADAGCLCGGVALATQFGSSVVAAETRPAWPVACRDSMLRFAGHEDCWSALHAIGAEGVEVLVADDLTLPYLVHPTTKYTLATAAGRQRLVADAQEAGQRITAFTTSNRFEARPDFEIRWCTEVAEAARTLSVPTICIDVQRHKLAPDEFLKLAVDALKKVLAATERTGVTLAIENHNVTTNKPEFLSVLFDEVGSKRLGLTLDTANFYGFGHPLSKVYELCETFATRIFHTHCKSIHYPAEQREQTRPRYWKVAEYTSPIDEGDLDFARIIAILHKAGYSNDLCVEAESKFIAELSTNDVTKRLEREIQFLKTLRDEFFKKEKTP